MITGKHVSRLSGYAPALPTPFDDNGNVDSATLEALCERQIQEGATALVVCGTTGEAPTLSRARYRTRRGRILFRKQPARETWRNAGFVADQSAAGRCSSHRPQLRDRQPPYWQ
jgi:Dihydrodipicolinate synthetase family